MIPERIYVEGFLCYRTPQEARFADCTLWMLAGPNGSGKSALFDAVTYTLYAQHRGGRHNARGLINQACDRFVLEFDFQIDGRLFRARRTLTRQGRPTRQLYQWTASDSGGDAGSWIAIPETHTEQGFTRWIHDHVGFTFETFTASVLLMQGKAENLLLAAPSQRHALLCQVVGMDRITRLHERARQQATVAQGAASALRSQMKRLPRVTKKQLAELQRESKRATARHSALVAELEKCRQQVAQSTRWHEIQQQQKELQASLDQLSPVVSRQDSWVATRQRLQAVSTQLDTLTALATISDRAMVCRRQLEPWEQRDRELERQLAILAAETQKTEEQRVETDRQLADATARQAALLEKHTTLVQAVSPLERLHDARQRMRAGRHEAAAVRNDLKQARARLSALNQEVPSEDALARAAQESRAAAAQLASSQSLADQLNQCFQRFTSVASETVCRYCRQPLPAVHVRREQARLEEEIAAAKKQGQEARSELERADTFLHKLQQRHRDLAREQLDVNTRTAALANRLQVLTELDPENQRQCSTAYDELPETFRQRVAEHCPKDWTATRFPTRQELAAVQQALADTADELRAARSTADQNQQLQRELGEAQRQLGNRRQALDRSRRECSRQLAEQRQEMARCEERYAAAIDRLPEHSRDRWRDAPRDALARQICMLEEERASLQATAGPELPDNAQQVRTQWAALNTRLQMLREELASIPEDARQSPQVAGRALQQQQHKVQQGADACHKAAGQEQQAVEKRRQRDALADEYRQHDRQLLLWNRLAELLGGNHLQRDMLKSAQRAIVDYANTILDRLASGALLLELRHPSNDRAAASKTLDLVARVTSSPADVQDVAFLSGSQKFRVAVALSLAIGQYASHTRRPVQAVIIDEGFGCLDTVNRQVMIQELQNLRSQLSRILLVSHQDEFAGAFPDGYRCELVDGTTRLVPFHR